MAAKAVLLVVAEAADETGFTFIGHDEIASRAEMGKRTVVEHMQELEARGLIKRQRRFNPADGSRTSNNIFLQLSQSADGAPRPLLQSAGSAPRQPSLDAAPALRTAAKVQITGRLSADERAPKCGSRTLTSQEPVNRRQTLEKPSDRAAERPAPISSAKAAFEAWWAVYPRKVERKKAEKLFDAVLRRGEATADELIEGAQRYAATDTVARGFIKHPTTWLNGGCWADEGPTRTNVRTASEPVSDEDRWRHRLVELRANQFWNTTDWGPKPGRPGCVVPPAILAEFGFGGPNVVALRGGAA